MNVYLPLFLLTLSVTFMAGLYALVQRDRATNLEIDRDHLRDQLCEAHAALDDAQREADRYRTSNAHLIAENTTLCVDLAYGESIVSACRSHRQRRRDAVAGWIVLSGLAREGRKMVAWERGAP